MAVTETKNVSLGMSHQTMALVTFRASWNLLPGFNGNMSEVLHRQSMKGRDSKGTELFSKQTDEVEGTASSYR